MNPAAFLVYFNALGRFLNEGEVAVPYLSWEDMTSSQSERGGVDWPWIWGVLILLLCLNGVFVFEPPLGPNFGMNGGLFLVGSNGGLR